MLSEHKRRADTYLGKEENMPAMCLNTDAPRMLLLSSLFADGLGSHVGRKWRHPDSITAVVFQASSWAEDVWLFMKTVSDPFWGFSYLCFSWLFPWSWYLSAQLPRGVWPCLAFPPPDVWLSEVRSIHSLRFAIALKCDIFLNHLKQLVI